MAQKPSTTPMECQRHYYGDAQPMVPAPTERAAASRTLARAMADDKADALRKRSLKAQRDQISENKSEN
jgi:hypothetical protein